MCETRVLRALLDFICKALMQPGVMQTAECVYIWTTLNITQFINGTLLLETDGNYWTIMESLQIFPAFSLYRSLAVIACWFPAKQLSGEKHFQSTEVWLWNPTMNQSVPPWNIHSMGVEWVFLRFFFSSLGHLQWKWGPGGVPLPGVPFAVRFAVMQCGSCNTECLLCFEELLCKYTTENSHTRSPKMHVHIGI